MRTLHFLAASLLIAISLPVVFAADSIKVTSIVDGDTFKAKVGTKVETVRIIGIDTTETVDPRKAVQCFGKEASAQLKKLLNGKTVTLIANPAEDRDIYKRLLRYVEIDDKDIGASMIADGYAHSYKQYPHPRLDAYNALEKTAREGNKGLWGSCNASSASSKAAKKSGKTVSSAASSKTTCIIKGNISTTREKIYHVKGCKNYESTQIDTAAGERWFCSESDAKAAGWRKAGNC